MRIKQCFILFFLFVCSQVYSYDYPYECVYESTPEELKDYFFSPLPGGKILYGGTDRHGRYLIEKRPPGRPSELYALYKDEQGELWQSWIDQQTRTETPFVYIKEPDSDDYEGFHPDEIKTMHLIPKENILYPPQDMPKLIDDDYTIIDLLFDTEHQNTPSSDSPALDQTPAEKPHYQNIYDVEQPMLVETTEDWWPYIAIGGSIVGLWAIGFYYLLSNTAIGARYLHRYDLWSAWRAETDPYEVILKLEPHYLADDLIQDITIRYFEEANPVQCFLDDLQVEYDTLLQWLQFRQQLSNLYIPLGEAFYMIENRLALLEHMRNAVYHWRAEQLRSNKTQSKHLT